MICCKCKKLFFIKRSFLDLFNEKKEYLCNSCYKSYPIKLNLETLSLPEHNIVIISIFDKPYPIDYNWYQEEYSKIFEANYFRNGYITLFFDFLVFNNETIELLQTYCSLFLSNLIIICFYIKY